MKHVEVDDDGKENSWLIVREDIKTKEFVLFTGDSTHGVFEQLKTHDSRVYILLSLLDCTVLDDEQMKRLVLKCTEPVKLITLKVPRGKASTHHDVQKQMCDVMLLTTLFAAELNLL